MFPRIYLSPQLSLRLSGKIGSFVGKQQPIGTLMSIACIESTEMKKQETTEDVEVQNILSHIWLKLNSIEGKLGANPEETLLIHIILKLNNLERTLGITNGSEASELSQIQLSPTQVVPDRQEETPAYSAPNPNPPNYSRNIIAVAPQTVVPERWSYIFGSSSATRQSSEKPVTLKSALTDDAIKPSSAAIRARGDTHSQQKEINKNATSAIIQKFNGTTPNKENEITPTRQSGTCHITPSTASTSDLRQKFESKAPGFATPPTPIVIATTSHTSDIRQKFEGLAVTPSPIQMDTYRPSSINTSDLRQKFETTPNSGTPSSAARKKLEYQGLLSGHAAIRTPPTRSVSCVTSLPSTVKVTFQAEIAPFLQRCLQEMRSFMPPNIFTIRKSEFQSLTKYSLELHNRLWNKQALWLLYKSGTDFMQISHVDLDSKYSVMSQNFDIVELAAIYAVTPKLLDNRFKMEWKNKLEKALKKLWNEKKEGRLIPSRYRHHAYADQIPFYG